MLRGSLRKAMTSSERLLSTRLSNLRRNLGRPPVGAAGNGKSNPRARSTRNGPQHSPRRPTSERPRRPGDYDVNGWPHTIFSPERRSPTGANGTSGTVPSPRGRLAHGRSSVPSFASGLHPLGLGGQGAISEAAVEPPHHHAHGPGLFHRQQHARVASAERFEQMPSGGADARGGSDPGKRAAGLELGHHAYSVGGIRGCSTRTGTRWRAARRPDVAPR